MIEVLFTSNPKKVRQFIYIQAPNPPYFMLLRQSLFKRVSELVNLQLNCVIKDANPGN